MPCVQVARRWAPNWDGLWVRRRRSVKGGEAAFVGVEIPALFLSKEEALASYIRKMRAPTTNGTPQEKSRSGSGFSGYPLNLCVCVLVNTRNTGGHASNSKPKRGGALKGGDMGMRNRRSGVQNCDFSTNKPDVLNFRPVSFIKVPGNSQRAFPAPCFKTPQNKNYRNTYQVRFRPPLHLRLRCFREKRLGTIQRLGCRCRGRGL